MERINLVTIGTVHNDVDEPVDAGWGDVESSIDLHLDWRRKLLTNHR